MEKNHVLLRIFAKNKFKKLTVVLSIGFIAIIFANKILADNKNPLCIDIYKTDKFTADDIRAEYGNQINEMINIYLADRMMPDQSKLKSMLALGKKIKEGIRAKGNFLYLNTYMTKTLGLNNVCYKVDIVDKKDYKRLSNFLPKPTKSFIDPDNLLSLWDGYFALGYKKFTMDFKEIKYKSCPAFHCTFGFQDPDFKKYENIFFTLVPKNKEKLVAILREDKDSEKRANAAFLLAHITNGNELINILLPAMHDSDLIVRSHVMEVLATTLFQMKTADFPVQAAIDALDFPDEDNRFQGLRLLAEISKQRRYRAYIKEQAKTQLITQLKMENSILHDNAYEILKQISSLKFGEHDYNSWENWLNKTNV